MLKQVPSRNQRSKGFKVKHFLQICVLIALFVWLFNRLMHSYDTQNPVSHEHILEDIANLGRKHLYPRPDKTSSSRETDKTELLDEEIKVEDTERVEDEESEEVEDLIDVDDRDRDVGNEEQDSEEDKSQDVASTSLLHITQTLSTTEDDRNNPVIMEI
ncbi:hypothetical protein M5689_016870 [Euphorbia peplus]|nr:hypothetical protein M5689_016870 [Euphorbia peplus]